MNFLDFLNFSLLIFWPVMILFYCYLLMGKVIFYQSLRTMVLNLNLNLMYVIKEALIKSCSLRHCVGNVSFSLHNECKLCNLSTVCEETAV